MSLFDKKEEVLSTELTILGKKQLATGVFRPVYYAFFDDDVLYDTTYAGFSESHTSSKDRIKEAISFKPFYSIATNQREDVIVVKEPLGNSSVLSEYAPAWDIKVLNNSFLSCSISPAEASMQIDVTSQAKPEKSFFERPDTEILYKTNIYQDKAYLEIRRNYVLLDVREINEAESITSGKFELEVYLLEDGLETLVPNFEKYLSIFCDEEINQFIVCEKISDSGTLFQEAMKKCENPNQVLVLGADSVGDNIYNEFDPERGEIC